MRLTRKRRPPQFPPAPQATPPAMMTMRFGPNENAAPGQYEPGDFILTYSSGFNGRLIRLGQWLRYRGADRKYIRWNHAAVIETEDGGIIEAVGTGVQRNHISHYGPTEYVVVRVGGFTRPEDREQIVSFAQWCLGEEYGFATIFSIAFNLLTGCKFTFGVDGQSICSGLVARALERTNAIFQSTPSHVAPADLAKFFDIPAPEWLGAPSRVQVAG